MHKQQFKLGLSKRLSLPAPQASTADSALAALDSLAANNAQSGQQQAAQGSVQQAAPSQYPAAPTDPQYPGAWNPFPNAWSQGNYAGAGAWKGGKGYGYASYNDSYGSWRVLPLNSKFANVIGCF